MTLTDDIKRPENSHIWQREQHEHYVEPEWCSQRLFQTELFNGAIWDPACGFGRIPAAASAFGYRTWATDIVDRGYARMDFQQDFLRKSPIWPGADHPDNIVSNPPFDMFRTFAIQALNITRGKVALIWLVRTLPAARWLEQTPLRRILLLTPRPSMPPGHTITAGEKPGGGKQDFCWLVWERGYRHKPEIGWLHRDSAND